MTNKKLIKSFGLYEANLIGLFATVSNYNEIQNPDADGWFYVTYERIKEELNLTEDKAEKPIKALVDSGILMVKKEGIPYRKFFKFNNERLSEVLISIAGTRSGKNGGLEQGKTGNKSSENPETSTRKTPDQERVKTVANKNTNKNTLKEFISLPLEEKKVFVRKVFKEKFSEFKSDSDKYCNFRERKKGGWKSVGNLEEDLKWWEENHKNMHPEKYSKNLPTEPEEIQNIRSSILRAMILNQMDYHMYFAAKPIEKTSSGFIIKVEDERALKYQEILKNINVKIEEN